MSQQTVVILKYFEKGWRDVTYPVGLIGRMTEQDFETIRSLFAQYCTAKARVYCSSGPEVCLAVCTCGFGMIFLLPKICYVSATQYSPLKKELRGLLHEMNAKYLYNGVSLQHVIGNHGVDDIIFNVNPAVRLQKP